MYRLFWGRLRNLGSPKSCLKNVVSLQIGLLARIAKTNSVSGKYLFFQIVFELILLFTLS
jgi:hypothetical protein